MSPVTQTSADLASIGLSVPGAATSIPKEDVFLDNLPPVFQFPVQTIVKATFYEAGPKRPLPFPELED